LALLLEEDAAVVPVEEELPLPQAAASKDTAPTPSAIAPRRFNFDA
jgi:hypothetical protein